MRNFNNRYRWLTRALGRLGLSAALVMTAAWAQAQVAIESVTGSVQSGVEVVRIDLSQALTVLPTGFSIQSLSLIHISEPTRPY